MVHQLFLYSWFPHNCTLVKVIPIHKNGNKFYPNNYRPISILTFFSKILEHITYIRFIEFPKKHSIICKSQYRFQNEISTVHAMLDLVTTSFDSINNELYKIWKTYLIKQKLLLSSRISELFIFRLTKDLRHCLPWNSAI